MRYVHKNWAYVSTEVSYPIANVVYLDNNDLVVHIWGSFNINIIIIIYASWRKIKWKWKCRMSFVFVAAQFYKWLNAIFQVDLNNGLNLCLFCYYWTNMVLIVHINLHLNIKDFISRIFIGFAILNSTNSISKFSKKKEEK